jgi:hypothetical protein
MEGRFIVLEVPSLSSGGVFDTAVPYSPSFVGSPSPIGRPASFPTGGDIFSTPWIGDLDGDHENEIVFGSIPAPFLTLITMVG